MVLTDRIYPIGFAKYLCKLSNSMSYNETLPIKHSLFNNGYMKSSTDLISRCIYKDDPKNRWRRKGKLINNMSVEDVEQLCGIECNKFYSPL